MINWFVNKLKKQLHRLNAQKLKDRLMVQNLYILSAQRQIQTLRDEIKLKNQNRLELYGYKVYSQNDEDGIIQEIFHRIGTTNKTFVEIGIGDGLENNTYFLLHRGWNGFWIEGSQTNAKKIRKNFAPLLNNKRLSIIEQYIDKDNTNQILENQNVEKDIDLFSIDIDGNDFYILEVLAAIEPRVIVAEYNGKFPADTDWCMEYNPLHRWTGSDKMGVALKTLTEMLQKKGYALVGTNIVGANAFYVKKELCQNLFASVDDIPELYNPARYHLTPSFVVGHPAKELIINV